jgi:hypothetical protein
MSLAIAWLPGGMATRRCVAMSREEGKNMATQVPRAARGHATLLCIVQPSPPTATIVAFDRGRAGRG